LFLEEIKLKDDGYGLRGDFLPNDALAAWQGEVVPLLEMNRQHEHRLTVNADLNQESLVELYERLIQVRTHPKKLYKLLRDFPGAMILRQISE
jgi:hypothetical protein